MSKKEQKLKKNLSKAFWISLPLFAWKQDYLPHSDKIKNIKKLRKTVIKPMKKCRI